MNPGEQDQNPFRRPGSFVGSQNSATPTNTSKYFGARSRFNRNRGSSQITSIQQPSFASYAAEPSYPAQQAARPVNPAAKKRKKIIAIVGFSIAAIVILISVGVTVINNTGILNIGKNHNLSELQEVMKKYYPYVGIAWEQNQNCDYGQNKLWDPEYTTDQLKEKKEQLAETEKEIAEFLKELEKFGGIKGKNSDGEIIEVDTYIETIKNKTKILYEFFQKFRKTFDLIIDIYINNGSDESIDALKDSSNDEEVIKLAKYYKDFYTAYKSLKTKVENKTCDQKTCDELYDTMNKNKKYLNDGTFDKILKKLYVDLGENQGILFLMQEIYLMKQVEE